MFTKDEEISLLNLAEGAGIELFDLELIRVIKNIEDPNNQKKFKREINLVVEFTPTDAKGMIDVKIGVKTKLAARNVHKTNVVYGRDPLTQSLEAREFVSQQQPLPGFGPKDSKPAIKKTLQ